MSTQNRAVGIHILKNEYGFRGGYSIRVFTSKSNFSIQFRVLINRGGYSNRVRYSKLSSRNSGTLNSEWI